MKFEKTYRDFVNEIITEGNNKSGAHSTAFKNLMKEIQKPKEEKFNARQIMKNYAKAFVMGGEDTWLQFIKALVAAGGGTTPVEVTKYQFMQAFFQFYFDSVFDKNVKTISKYLDQASESIQLEKDDYTKGTIKKVYKLIKKGEKNKKIFVSIFNSLTGGGW